jgi:hypothetical protein
MTCRKIETLILANFNPWNGTELVFYIYYMGIGR